jgi:microcystin degradation protein MlrC
MHETNTFSNIVTDEAAFREIEWASGEQLKALHRNVSSYLGGILDEASRLGIETISTFGASAVPSGIITREVYEQMKRNILDGIKQANEFDAVCLALHGAGVAEGIEDIEGDLLQAVRELVGRAVPIVVTLDLHANVTPLMVEHADMLIGNQEYPHIDSYDRGVEAAGWARRIALGEVRPVMKLIKPAIMIPTLRSTGEPIASINALCQQLEQSAQAVLDCTFFHGFSGSDIAECGIAIVTITNGDEALADRIGEQVANYVESRKPALFPSNPTPEQGIELALQSPHRPVVMNETSDNPGGGTPGDGTHLLRAMVALNVADSCFGFIYDPETVQQAKEAGVGAYVDVRLGGKTDTIHGEPLELRAYVKALTDGRFTLTSPMNRGREIHLGTTVRLVVGSLDIIVSSSRHQVFDEQVFLLHGIDIKSKKIVALKSSHHFRAAFEQLSEQIITVDSPGLTTFDFTVFPFRHIRRPMYPFDK